MQDNDCDPVKQDNTSTETQDNSSAIKVQNMQNGEVIVEKLSKNSNHVEIKKRKSGQKAGITLDQITYLTEIKGLNVSEAAKELGVNPTTIWSHFNRANLKPGYLQGFKDRRADEYALLQKKILNSITEKDIIDATLMQRMTAVGILSDKEFRERQGADLTVAFADMSANYEAVRAQRIALEHKLGKASSDTDTAKLLESLGSTKRE